MTEIGPGLPRWGAFDRPLIYEPMVARLVDDTIYRR